MKSLSLYIDKWYISGAVYEDGTSRPIRACNGEDRFWLYFQEDLANNQISYGKAFERRYNDKEPGYIGDVFTMLTRLGSTFSRYTKHKDDLINIFEAAGIIDELKAAVEPQERPDVYLCFSPDIPDTSKYAFINELKEHGLNVVANVARLSHLALEEAHKRGVSNTPGAYLVLEATNENMHFAIYDYDGKYFLRRSEDTLTGYGYDVRRKALVEFVVENINSHSRMLQSAEEIAGEHKRMEAHADSWLEEITQTSPTKPVSLPNISFAVAPNNTHSVTVILADLDKRTNVIVGHIMRSVSLFLKDNNVSPGELNGIVFIGNTFTNEGFRTVINSKINIADERIINYLDQDIPRIVSVYNCIDCDQFSTETSVFFDDAEKELHRQKQLQEEEEKQRKAEAEREAQRKAREASRTAERKYNEAMEKAESYEQQEDYDNMISWLDLALTLRPDDVKAKDKKEQAQRLLDQKRERIIQFNQIMKRAKSLMEEQRYTDVISQCDLALDINQQSKEAARVKEEARKRLESAEQIRNYTERADVFFAQKLYREASEELDKILSLQPSNQEAIKRKRQIKQKLDEHRQEISRLEDTLQDLLTKKMFEQAIKICDQLIHKDTADSIKWTEKRAEILAEMRAIEKEKQHLKELWDKIQTAHFEDDWADLKRYCQEYLAIRHEDGVKVLLDKAIDRLNKQAGSDLINKVKALISDGQREQAAEALTDILRNHPELAPDIRSLQQRLNRSTEPTETDRQHNKKQESPPQETKTTRTSESQNKAQDSTQARTKDAGKRAGKGGAMPAGDDDFFDDERVRPKNKGGKKKNDDKYDFDF